MQRFKDAREPGGIIVPPEQEHISAFPRRANVLASETDPFGNQMTVARALVWLLNK